MSRSLPIFALVAAFAAGTAAGAVEIGYGTSLSAYAFGDVRSAYVSRGKVVNNAVFSPVYGRLAFNLPYGFYFGASWWSVSAYENCGQSAVRRYAFHENDPNAFAGYRWRLADGWTLDSHVHRQWVLLEGYRGCPSTVREWQAGQSLENPYATPYYLMRHAHAPRPWTHWEAGLRHRFDLGHGLYFTPTFFADFGDAQHFQDQYGNANYASSFDAGLMALNLRLRLGWWATKWLTLYGEVHQFDVVDAKARDALEASTAKQSCTDLAVFTIGAALSF